MDKRQVFCNGKGTLYLIATPIGNLSDISSRTRETIDMVEYLLCEDTRITGNLLKAYKKNNIADTEDKS